MTIWCLYNKKKKKCFHSYDQHWNCTLLLMHIINPATTHMYMCAAFKNVNILSGHYRNNKDETPCTFTIETLNRIQVLDLHQDQDALSEDHQNQPVKLRKICFPFMWSIVIALLMLSQTLCVNTTSWRSCEDMFNMARFSFILSTSFFVYCFERVVS